MSVASWLLGRPYWEYSLTVAVVSAVVFAVGRIGGRGNARVVAFAGDLAMIAFVFAIYQHTVHYARLHTAGAFEHARGVVDVEKWLHINNELGLQQHLLPHPWLVKLLNGYYESVHLPSMIIFILWLLWFHRPAYPAARNVVFVSTLACVLIQINPVAPPRLLPGFTDTALVYGQSVYGYGGSEIAGQLAAMPSIHVAWAAIIAWYAVTLSRSSWRWVWPAHFVMTLVVVVGTANHWWLDGIVSVGIVAASIGVQSLVDHRVAERRAGRRDVVPDEPVDAAGANA